jgi:hypothetical protein
MNNLYNINRQLAIQGELTCEKFTSHSIIQTWNVVITVTKDHIFKPTSPNTEREKYILRLNHEMIKCGFFAPTIIVISLGEETRFSLFRLIPSTEEVLLTESFRDYFYVHKIGDTIDINPSYSKGCITLYGGVPQKEFLSSTESESMVPNLPEGRGGKHNKQQNQSQQRQTSSLVRFF